MEKMGNWARRMHRRAATIGQVVISCARPSGSGTRFYPQTIEKVKFGVPVADDDDIPAPLLVLILRLNKEGPVRREVFRAPGHQVAMTKLIHFLRTGRLINVENYSVNTIASVIKKYLRKIPDGVFGKEGEAILLAAGELSDELFIIESHNVIKTLPLSTQRVLVLLFGTFKTIAVNSLNPRMTAEALGVSAAPSFFNSCVSDENKVVMNDVLRFKVRMMKWLKLQAATRVMRKMIELFSAGNVFGRENYEFYARVTGRVLRVQNEWIVTIRHPALPLCRSAIEAYAEEHSLQAGLTWLQCECVRWDKKGLLPTDESQSMPTLTEPQAGCSSDLDIIPENTLDSCTRLSSSLEEGVFKISVSVTASSTKGDSSRIMPFDELRYVNKYVENAKSLTDLPQVHERQRARMLTRSEWFLRGATPSPEVRSMRGGESSSFGSIGRVLMCGTPTCCSQSESGSEVAVDFLSRQVIDLHEEPRNTRVIVTAPSGQPGPTML